MFSSLLVLFQPDLIEIRQQVGTPVIKFHPILCLPVRTDSGYPKNLDNRNSYLTPALYSCVYFIKNQILSKRNVTSLIEIIFTSRMHLPIIIFLGGSLVLIMLNSDVLNLSSIKDHILILRMGVLIDFDSFHVLVRQHWRHVFALANASQL